MHLPPNWLGTGLLSGLTRARLLRQGCVRMRLGLSKVHGGLRRRLNMHLKLTKRTVDGILAIECNGRIVLGEESALLRDEVKGAIAGGAKRIVLNLGEVNY